MIPIFAKGAMGEFGNGGCQAVAVKLIVVGKTEFTNSGHRVRDNSR